MRARTDNDYIIGNPRSYYREWVDAGIDKLRTIVVDCTACQAANDQVTIRCLTRHVAKGKDAGIACLTTYTIQGNGEILVESRIDIDASLPVVPRIGMSLGVAAGFEKLRWYGCGPHESYPDRKHSTLVGIYESTVDAQFIPFVDPCECGGHEDTRWIELTDDGGHGLRVVGEPTLHVSALHYTVEDLIQAGHVYELNRTDDIQLCLDGFHMGLGGDTGWTRNVHPEYLLPPGTYRYGFRLQPLV